MFQNIRMYSLYLCIVFTVIAFFSIGLCARQGQRFFSINIEEITRNSIDFSELMTAFVDSFSFSFSNINGLNSDKKFLKNFLEKIIKREEGFKRPFYIVVAKNIDKVVGGIMFTQEVQPEVVYGAILAVEYEYRNQGIGKKLILSIFEKLPKTKEIVWLTPKKNIPAINYYKKLGCKEVIPSISHICRGYNLEKHCAMGWSYAAQ